MNAYLQIQRLFAGGRRVRGAGKARRIGKKALKFEHLHRPCSSLDLVVAFGPGRNPTFGEPSGRLGQIRGSRLSD